MSEVDRQRVSAVRTLEALGYAYRGAGQWGAPASASAPTDVAPEADRMLAMLMQRADELDSCAEGSEEEAELVALIGAIESYETRRWPDGKEAGGKG
jgi:hypothetical protein